MACASNTDCAAGLSCASGVCHTYCTTAGADCSAGVCVQVGDGSQIQDKLCTVDCTLSPDSCGSGQTCVPFVVDDSPVSGDCEAPGSVAFDGSCTSLYDCAAGLACITEYGVCLPWCQTTSFCQSALGDSYNCYFDVSVTIEGTTYGYCD
jgi:hypothetical protein